jgi:hypothetical protein
MHALLLGLLAAGAPLADAAAPATGTDAQTPADSSSGELAPLGADSAWQGLDAEIESLASSAGFENDGPHLGAWAKIDFRSSNDSVLYGLGLSAEGDTKVSTFNVNSARLMVTGDVGRTYYEVSADFSSTATSTGVELKDAFADINFYGSMNFTFGQFRAPLAYSGLIYEKDTLLPDRSLIGDTYDERDVGVMWYSHAGPTSLYLALQDGTEVNGAEYSFSGRLAYDFMGRNSGGAYNGIPGAMGAPDETVLSAAVFGQADNGLDRGILFGADAGMVVGPFSVYGEVVSYDEEYDPTVLNPLLPPALAESVAGTNPWSGEAAWLLGDSAWEIVGRYEAVDDTFKTIRGTIGANYYVGRTLDAKWQFAFTSQESDTKLLQGDLFVAGLTVGI